MSSATPVLDIYPRVVGNGGFWTAQPDWSVDIGSDTLFSMRSRASHVAATLVLLICVSCPILEIFDRWDHTVETGSDTEYTFVVVGLCAGVACTFARLFVKFPPLRAVVEVVSNFCTGKSSVWCVSCFLFPIPLSPPGLALRI
jgi:hypothetical protein